jgi:hypothetical protein
MHAPAWTFLLMGDEARRRTFFFYEKRLRERSTPDKVFAYHASIRASAAPFFPTNVPHSPLGT